jgi:hypothetical protein
MPVGQAHTGVGVTVGVGCHHVQAVTANKINRMDITFMVFLLISIHEDVIRATLVPILDAGPATENVIPLPGYRQTLCVMKDLNSAV